MRFEGLELSGPEDIADHVRVGTQTRPRDARSVEWVIRFCREHPELAGWADEALVRIAKEWSGDPIRPTPQLRPLFHVAQRCGLRGLRRKVSRRLEAGTEDLSDDELHALLEVLLGFRPKDLDGELLDQIERAAARPIAFSNAFSLLALVDTERAVQAIADHLGPALEETEDPSYVHTVLAEHYVLSRMEPHRTALAEAIGQGGEEMREAFRDRVASVAWRGERAELLAELDEAWSRHE